MTAPALAWTRGPDGVYTAAGARHPGDDAFTDRSWHVWKLPNRRWIIKSSKTTRQRSTYSHSLEPVAVESTRHGAAHTLREARDFAASADRFLSTTPTQEVTA